MSLCDSPKISQPLPSGLAPNHRLAASGSSAQGMQTVLTFDCVIAFCCKRHTATSTVTPSKFLILSHTTALEHTEEHAIAEHN